MPLQFLRSFAIHGDASCEAIFEEQPLCFLVELAGVPAVRHRERMGIACWAAKALDIHIGHATSLCAYDADAEDRFLLARLGLHGCDDQQTDLHHRPRCAQIVSL